MVQSTHHALRKASLIGAALMACASVFAAQDYPTRPITMVVPYGIGGTTDLSARKLASLAQEALGQPIVIENRLGGSGAIAMRTVAHAKPDGYTLIATTSSPLFVTPAVRPVGYQPLEDFTPIMNYSGPYHGVLVTADSPYHSIKEVIDSALAGTTIRYGTAGALGGPHMAFELIANETGAPLKHIPFNGAASTTAALLNGRIDMALVPAYRDLVESGQLTLLGVLDNARDPDFEQVATLSEAGYDVSFPSVVGILAPAGTQDEIVSKLEKVFIDAASSGEFIAFMNRINQPVRIMTGQDLGKQIKANLATYRALIEQLH
ncbi:Tripartite tricarboxylate transporter family receptor [Marinomonas aquimarina]|uniref:Tripartite tricarboxylate transporter family receptor n=1 Tax=Marinomonas aquimarina TaxID=295068 RepID=A0A1A8T061_9GAMM|nr:tripartite tricarboxylate transporter substrate binding protein [Marinomonas aquimarina]SBS25193.1 Tripartite tricarboxylate transporter family receptor [Marinomonas aquimarina]